MKWKKFHRNVPWDVRTKSTVSSKTIQNPKPSDLGGRFVHYFDRKFYIRLDRKINSRSLFEFTYKVNRDMGPASRWEIYVSFWNSDDSWSLKTEEEMNFGQSKSFEMRM